MSHFVFLGYALLVVVMPFGVAAQSIVAGLAALISFFFFRRDQIPRSELVCAFLLFCLLLTTWVASLLNSGMDIKSPKFMAGYIFTMLGPLFLVAARSATLDLRKLVNILLAVCFVWGVMAASQHFFPWRVIGSGFVPDVMDRARGLYSHPLSLAYATMLLFPLTVSLVLHDWRSLLNWLGFLGVLSCLVFSASRVAQLVCLVQGMVLLVLMLRRRVRMALLALTLLTVAVLGGTDNFVSRAFTERKRDNTSGYADDRVAFWHVHWEMFKERPLLGHGDATHTLYRTPYYEALGLGGMEKKYEAHNMYLQVMVNSGSIGLLFFLAFWVVRLRQAASSPYKSVAYVTIVGFLVAGLTQNGFQDASVRNVFTILMIGFLLTSREGLSARA